MKILIVEDEDAAARRLRRMIEEILPSASIVDNLETVSSVVSWLRINHQPDLILMDIHLADANCFEIFKQIEITSSVIFITAYDQYALQAFKVNSIDYLLKPVKKDELQASLLKWEKSHKQLDYSNLINQMLAKVTEKPQRFVVKYGQYIKAIDASDVALFYAEEKTINLLTFDNESFPVDYSLDKLNEILDNIKFFRVNRAVIINYKAISQMFSHLKGKIKIQTSVKTNLEIYVSTDRAHDFKLWLSGKHE